MKPDEFEEYIKAVQNEMNSMDGSNIAMARASLHPDKWDKFHENMVMLMGHISHKCLKNNYTPKQAAYEVMKTIEMNLDNIVNDKLIINRKFGN